MNAIINTTPHNVNIVKDKKVVNTFLKSDNPLRLSTTSNQVGDLDGIPVMSVTFGDVELPAFQPDTYYIVSALIKNAFPDRTDLIVPFDLVRDDNGIIIGCKSFSK